MQNGVPRFRLRWLSAMCLLAMGLAGCSVTLLSFTAPSVVWAGHTFEVIASGQASGTGTLTGILQLPAGCVLESAIAVSSGPGAPTQVWNAIRMATPPTQVAAELGHFLEGVVGGPATCQCSGLQLSLRLLVRAPNVPGTYTLKLALDGGNGIEPGGATSFAAITAAPHVLSVQVQAGPVDILAVEPMPAPGSPAGSFAGPMVIDDIDRDGRGDLVLASSSSFPLVVARQRTGGWLSAAVPTLPGALRDIATGDFDGDGSCDIVDNRGNVYFGDGGNTWTAVSVLPAAMAEGGAVAAGDIDGDGRCDLAIGGLSAAAVVVFRSGPGRTFANWSGTLPTQTYGLAGTNHMAIADVTGDGFADLIATGPIGLRVFAGNGAGQWSPLTAGLANLASEFLLGDIQGDGLLDVLTFAASGMVALQLVGGVSWQLVPVSVPLQYPVSQLAAADFDGDGLVDFAARSDWTDEVNLLRNLGGMTFGPPTVVLRTASRYAGTLPGRISVGDVDGDSWPDLFAFQGIEGLFACLSTASGVHHFGRPCAGPSGLAPTIAGVGQPSLGNSGFGLSVGGAAPTSLAVVWLGFDRNSASGVPLPLDLGTWGAPGCAVQVADDAVQFLIADSGGNAVMPFPIPNAPALRRMLVFGQGGISAPGANSLGWLLTGGLAVRIP
jgi:hypothetical protein